MTEAVQRYTDVVEELRDAQDILALLALSLTLIASPSTHILVARVTAVFAQHTAMAWAELLGDVTASGNPVPLCYGKRRVGGAIISAGIYAEDQM